MHITRLDAGHKLMPIIFILCSITEHYSHFDELSKKLEVTKVSI